MSAAIDYEQLIGTALSAQSKGGPLWHLAGLVKKKDDTALQHKPAVDLYAKKTGMNPLDAWAEFEVAYNRRKLTGDGFDWAARQAKRFPVRLPHGVEAVPEYCLLAGVATHLGQMLWPMPFALPTDKVIALFGCSQRTVSYMVCWLVNNKIIQWIGNTPVYGQGDKNRCKLYKLVGDGGPEDGLEHDAAGEGEVYPD